MCKGRVRESRARLATSQPHLRNPIGTPMAGKTASALYCPVWFLEHLDQNCLGAFFIFKINFVLFESRVREGERHKGIL